MSGGDPALRDGRVAREVAQEFPELRLVWVDGPVAPGPSPPEVRWRLRHLSDRVRGATAIALRQQPIPHAYRVFYRHVGLDPDADRTPAEAAIYERLFHGGFRSDNLVDDALTIAVVETGVPVWALDADTLAGELELRLGQDGEPLGRAADGPTVPAGSIVVADGRSALGVVFDAVAPGHGVTRASRRIRLFSLAVAGVSPLHVEEALWSCRGVLDAARTGA